MASNRFRPAGLAPIWLAVIAMVVAGLTVPAALGQGTNGMFPDPISTRDLDVVSKRLTLSPQQRQSIDLAHSEYRNAYAALRSTEIEAYMQAQSQQGGGMRGMNMNFDRDAVEKNARAYRQIITKIEQLDGMLFDQMQPSLTGQQLEILPRIRLARERDRYNAGPARFARFVNPGSRIDLSDLYRDLDLAPDVHAEIDPIIAQYERELTNASRAFDKDAREQQEEMIKRLERAGITQETMQDRRAARRAMETMRQTWDQMNRELSEESQKINDLNKRTYRTVVGLLPPEPARAFRSSYINRVYGEAAPVIGRAEREMKKAMKIEDLPDAIIGEIETLLVGTVNQLDGLTDTMVRVIDENRNTNSVFNFNRESRREYEEELDALRTKRDTANEQAIMALHALLGEDYASQMRQPRATLNLADGVFAGKAVMVTLDGGGGGGAMENFVLEYVAADVSVDMFSTHFSVDPYIPAPISGRDVKRYAAMLEVDEAMTPVIDGLHADYQEEFKTLETGDIKIVQDLNHNLWKFDPETKETTPPDPKDVERIYNLRQRVQEVIRAIDDSFFDNVELAFATDENAAMMRRIRLERERSMYNRGKGGGMMGASLPVFFQAAGGAQDWSFVAGGVGGSQASSVDLATVVSELELNETQRAAIDGILATYEAAAAAAFRRAFDAGMAVEEAQEKAKAESMTISGDGGFREVRINRTINEAGAEQQKIKNAAEEEIATLNQQSLDDMLRRLDPVGAQALEDAYNRRAYPEAFADPANAQPKLDTALAMDDLTGRQKQDLLDLSLTHRSEYRGLSDEMIEAIKAAPTTGDNKFEAMQQRMQSMERIRFTRNDLNDRTMAHLRLILTEDQFERLGGDEAQTGDYQFFDAMPGRMIKIGN